MAERILLIAFSVTWMPLDEAVGAAGFVAESLTASAFTASSFTAWSFTA
jgi:hypothetical protein